MIRAAAALTALFLAASPVCLAARPAPDIEIGIDIAIPERPVPSGGSGEAVLTLSLPPGIHLNQYPPIRLTLDPAPPLLFEQTILKQGLDRMPEEIDRNPFEKLEPMRVKFRVGPTQADAKVPVHGKLRYTYCVKKSGFCAPGTREIVFKIPVSTHP